MRHDLILRITSKLLLPFMFVFALYVQFHGDYGPGGGFQAGVIMAASVILYSIIFGLAAAKRVVPSGVVNFMVPAGVLLFAGVGMVDLMLGGNYLDYSVMGDTQVHGQHLGILLVELGVLITVMGTMTAMFYAFAGRGR